MNVVDSSGWLEYFADAANAEFFAAPILDTDNLLVPSISLLEVFKRVCQQRDENTALSAVALMRQGTVVDLDGELALSAAKLGIDHKLPLADSVILASARRHGATLWTQDADFEGLDGVRYAAKR
ncbi:MAG TPA: type II toxin-antitoxin system VapC family toxin [Gammaproteobacteria bacterium]|nr:type II toxin-antitoxin system VapC family toxin [Gammaproteobacteria bacterium]